MHKKIIICCGIFFIFLCVLSFGDNIYLPDKVLENIIVEKITSSEVILSGSRKIPKSKIKKIKFDNFNLPAKPGGIVLKDGSILNGIIREIDKKIIFRSTSFGILEFNKEEVAGIYYEYSRLAKLEKEEKNGKIIDRDGKIYKGKIVWFDSKSAGILSADGLKKIENNMISLIQLYPVEPGKKVILRNGDVLNSIDSYNGDSLTVKLAEKKASISLKALREINF